MVSVSALAEAPMHCDGQRVSAAQDLGKVAQDVLGGLNIARSDLHNLDLRGTNIAVLPEGLSLGGDLYLDSTKINALPEGLSVGGGLYLRGTKITALVGSIVDFDRCSRDEAIALRQLQQAWTKFAGADKKTCVGETTIGDFASYVELLTCLEMASGVRKEDLNPPDPGRGASKVDHLAGIGC
jgi:hypothetical protein